MSKFIFLVKKSIYIGMLFISASLFSQDKVAVLTDSLLQSKDPQKNVELSLKIADQLKFKNFERAKYYINLSKDNTQKIDTDEAWINFYKKSGKIYFDVDALDLFGESLLKQYEYYKNTTHERRYKLENQLAILYARLNDKDLALYYFNKLWEHYKKQKNYPMMAQTKTNIGNLHLNYDFPKKALSYFEEALVYLEKSQDKSLEQELLTNIGRTYTKLSQNEKALDFLTKAKSKTNDTTDKETQSWISQNIADVYIQMKNADQAILYARHAEKLDNTQNTFSQRDLLETLYKAYLLKKNYKTASEYFVKYDNARKNLNIESKAVNVEKIKIDYNNKIKNQELEIANNKKRSSLIIAICSLVILLLIFFIIIIKYKNKLLKAKLDNQLKEYKETQLKQELEIRNKELTIKTIKETEQKELYQFLMNDLKKIQSDAVKTDVKNTLNHVIKTMTQNDAYNNWEEFELRFSNVYESFYKKLDALHPNLSALDKRICALIKLNLSTKEIANITKSSIRSIENIRTRLRKKIGLTNSKTDLNKYLLEL
ncbi:hypothetical protein G6R40_09085 [Chryseobacterium sp. POL2]|uniref:tetratricopeptide repeat protein n=1 Tax=Chryseobacterium sp. POL2 TaxID=2713414 RepID=UPI0013E11D25|nr:hypothetical protein [Chryseobacterium sp. POL2]QIG89805.1 hypothetical protein G6R40_09085 [Chryseobacterium sp. POL2]